MDLISPSPEYEASYRDYIADLGNEVRYPFTLDFEHRDFPALLEKLEAYANGIDLPDGFVPSSTFWLVENGKVLGVSNLRHRLNDRIRHIGGHIGLGVRPGLRGRGIGAALMMKTIEKAAGLGISEVHIHCHKSNPASAKIIQVNGGVLESELLDASDGEIVQRYLVQSRASDAEALKGSP